MALNIKNKYNFQVRKLLIVLDCAAEDEKCSICDAPLYPARLESWQNDSLIDFKFHNGFCEQCGLFEYEPIKDTQICFQKTGHQETYNQEINSFI
ncbi:MAG: hypothetical protein BAJALOKI3v1_290031 [Promethearchaeota archaeon]|jgi:hypothetical protein|nr:MAG: hypothetical protein BAJALOKI3v1_290031 [Candidatus Lokiarchaeota archaeon]